MIDLAKENLIRLADVPRCLPSRNGKRLHISAVYRWVNRGLGDGAKLESIKIGGTTYTSVEALQRFAEHRPQANPNGDDGEPHLASRSRQRQIEQAARKAEQILNRPTRKKW